MDMIYIPLCKTVLYPTLNNSLYNCVVTHPTHLTNGILDNPKAKMMEICNYLTWM